MMSSTSNFAFDPAGLDAPVNARTLVVMIHSCVAIHVIRRTKDKSTRVEVNIIKAYSSKKNNLSW